MLSSAPIKAAKGRNLLATYGIKGVSQKYAENAVFLQRHRKYRRFYDCAPAFGPEVQMYNNY